MRKLFLLMILVLYMVITAFSEETIQKEFNIGPGKKLNVNLKTGGSISITGWEKEKIAVTLHFKKSTPGDWDIRFITGNADTIEIKADYKGGGHSKISFPDFEIQVPTQFNLDLRTMVGNINIRHVTGEITGKTMSGPLDLTYLKGFIDFKTLSGDIILKDSNIDGKLKTMAGRVLFENVKGDIKGSSMGGNVIYKNVRPREKGAEKLDLTSENSKKNSKENSKMVKFSTMGGDINVSDAPDGADVDTMGGNIHIKSAGNYVKAKTMGGNIIVDSIDGGIEATTRGGNMMITMTGNPQKGDRQVKLTSMGGDVTLIVPEGLSMDVDIDLVYTQKAKKDYNIVSDFQLKIEKTNSWDESNGTGKKYIYGKAQIAGGKNKIKLHTMNGNIYLKKSKD